LTAVRGTQPGAQIIGLDTPAAWEPPTDSATPATVPLSNVKRAMSRMLDALGLTVPQRRCSPGDLLEAYRPTELMASLNLPTKPVQRFDELFEIFRRSAGAAGPLEEHLRCVAKDLGLVAVNPPLKDESRAAQKAEVDTGRVRGVRDWARGTIVVPSVREVNEAVDRLLSSRRTFQGRFCADHLTTPRKSGLRQVQLFLEYVPQRILVEVQVTPQPMFDMYRVEHRVYEMVRAVEAELATRTQTSPTGDPGLSRDEADLLIRCGAFSRDCYRLATSFLRAGKPMPDELCAEYRERANSLVGRYKSTVFSPALGSLNSSPYAARRPEEAV
jgi:hypothetical protein